MAGRKRRLIWSLDARADLADVWNYYASQAGPRAANTFIEKIREATLPLTVHPHLGRTRDEIRPGLRSVVAGPYVIFYRVSSGDVSIVRVLHGRRDIDDVFVES